MVPSTASLHLLQLSAATVLSPVIMVSQISALSLSARGVILGQAPPVVWNVVEMVIVMILNS